MGGCQNNGPFFGYPKYQASYYNREPKRDHNFDNHPNEKHLKVKVKTLHPRTKGIRSTAATSQP